MPPRTQHRCFWPGCKIAVPRSKLGCTAHWYRLPRDIRTAVLQNYKPGQTLTTCTEAYLAALEDAMDYAIDHANSP